MTLELSRVASQVKAMGRSLDRHTLARQAMAEQAHRLLQEFSTESSALHERISRAETELQTQRFDWIGAAPTGEALAAAYPLPDCPAQITVIASDGSQILPDRHALTLYYLINIGCIVYRHGSHCKPETPNPDPILCYDPEDVLDERGNIIASGEIRARRDMAEVEILAAQAEKYGGQGEPVVALIDGQLPLRVIDLPFDRQENAQTRYIELLDRIRAAATIAAGYIDRPHSGFVLALMHLVSLELGQITEANLRRNPFRHLTDLDLFSFLGPGQRSAIFEVRTKGLRRYTDAEQGLHFFYLNLSQTAARPHLARIEIPQWVAAKPGAVDTLHAVIVRQARLAGGYPYVLARADELAIITSEERQAVEMMLAVAMRRQGLVPAVSLKQANKNAFRATAEGFSL